jgi:HD-like signal output (HDOD) protein
LSNRLADPNSKSSDIAELIARDVALTANLLRIVNSEFFGLPRRVTSIESAINFLGTAMLRPVVLSSSVTTALGPLQSAIAIAKPSLNQLEHTP